MKRNFIPHVIGIAFSILGSALLYVIISNWSLSVKTLKGLPALLAISCLFVIVGVAVLTIGITTNKKIKKYIDAKENGEPEETLFVLEDELKAFREKTVMIMCLPVPYILLTAFVSLFIYAFRQGKIQGGRIAIFSICIGFLVFVCVGITAWGIQTLFKKKTEKKHINGELIKFVLSNHIQVENNDVIIDEYRLLIRYKLEGKEYEFLTNETYSSEQIMFIKKCVYIPLIVDKNSICIDKEKLLKTTRQIGNNERIGVEKGVFATFGNEKIKQTDADQHVKKVTENIDKIDNRVSQEKGFNILFTIFVTLFLIVFSGISIFAVVKDQSGLVIAYAIVSLSFSAFMLYKAVISPIINYFRRNKVMLLGYSSVAVEYKLTVVGGTDNNGFDRHTYSVKYRYYDEFGILRKGYEPHLKVSQFYFSSYNVKTLPIKVYKKYAIIDYKELLKYQET